MADTAVTSRVTRYGEIVDILRDKNVAALTSGASKGEWVITCYCKIADVICNSETAGSGGTSDLIDVNINGTTIYTTQGNRPTLLQADTGMFTEALAGPDETLISLVPGDIVSWDVDQVSTTGSARFTITIILTQN